jgi:hypothetical protein
VEFEEKGRRARAAWFAVAVDGGDGQRVEQFDAGDRHADLDGLDDGLDRCIDAGEGADGGRHGLRDPVEPHGEFGDDAERAFGADQQTGEVVAGGGFLGAAAGADDAAVGQHDGQASTFSRIVP